MKSILQAAAAGLALATASMAVTPASLQAADAEPVYELRIYTTKEGKLPDLLKRFRDHTCKLF
ncbi:MAG: NIPSNAP family protein, partial [Verrucomicrobium sp.]